MPVKLNLDIVIPTGIAEGIWLTQCAGSVVGNDDGLPDHFGRLIEDDRRNRDAELLGRLQVDSQIEFLGPLHGEVCGVGPFQDLVHVRRRAAERVG